MAGNTTLRYVGTSGSLTWHDRSGRRVTLRPGMSLELGRDEAMALYLDNPSALRIELPGGQPPPEVGIAAQPVVVGVVPEPVVEDDDADEDGEPPADEAPTPESPAKGKGRAISVTDLTKGGKVR